MDGGHQPPLGRDGGHDHRRPRGRAQHRADQDRLDQPIRTNREVQPPAPNRGGARRRGRVRRRSRVRRQPRLNAEDPGRWRPGSISGESEEVGRQASGSSLVWARRRAAADSRLARVTATFALPAAVRGRSVALPAAAFEALAAATFLRCAVLLAVVRFLAVVAVVASAPSSRWAALALTMRRLLRRAALLGW